MATVMARVPLAKTLRYCVCETKTILIIRSRLCWACFVFSGKVAAQKVSQDIPHRVRGVNRLVSSKIFLHNFTFYD